MKPSVQHFFCDGSGYVRHWAIAGTYVTRYDGPPGSDNELRLRIVDETIEGVPETVKLGTPGPRGQVWTYCDPGANIFVERSHFYHDLSVLNLYGATDIEVSEDVFLPVQFWACGAADLWVNGHHVCRHVVAKYMYPDATKLLLNLNKGPNRLVVRLQALGVRDTRVLFGLQVLDQTDGLHVAIPGAPDFTQQMVEIETWLNGIRADGRDALISDVAAPVDAVVKAGDVDYVWEIGESRVGFDSVERTRLTVTVEEQLIERMYEFPANRVIPVAETLDVNAHRQQMLKQIASRQGRSRNGVMAVLARHTLSERSPDDSAILFDALNWIDGRPDCADFPLSAILRLYCGSTLTEDERLRIKQTALSFRYWMDEPGNDAMCFNSENHSLLFHGCQMIAGNLFPDHVFSNSGRTGKEQAKIGAERCVKWLEHVEHVGFGEFLSSTYMPLTCAALMNLVDFAPDKEMSHRAAKLVASIFDMLAMHAFDGVTVGPQGRVYRNVLIPDASGTQAMLSYASPTAVVAHNDWLSFVAASPHYRMPDGIAAIMQNPVSKTYRQASVEIQIEKTADFLLTSLQIPASFQKPPSKVNAPQSTHGLWPGRQGYQQHIWHATLGRDCHVFVNHPGASFDLSSSRPGFWYGNGFLPRTVQDGNMVMQIFDIPDQHPIHFTHAHWPGDVFDRQDVTNHWAFGQKGKGCVGLWCSAAMRLCSEVLTNRELRAEGQQVAWVAFCGGTDTGDLTAFKQSCMNRRPAFDAEVRVLTMDKRVMLRYQDL